MPDEEDLIQAAPFPRQTDQITESSSPHQDITTEAEHVTQEKPVTLAPSAFANVILALRGTVPHKRKKSDYTSRWFFKLPEPMPVGDVLSLKPRTLILLRYNVRLSLKLVKVMLLPLGFLFMLLLVITSAILMRTWPAPGEIFHLTTDYLNLEHRIWRSIGSRIFLRGNKRAELWWFIYLLLSDFNEFEDNYMKAWTEHAPEGKSFAIFLGDERLIIPILEDDNKDKMLLKHLRMFYRLLKIRRGLSELILPKVLVRVDWVKLDYDSNVVCEKIKPLGLGRRSGTMVAFFHKPDLVKDDTTEFVDELRDHMDNGTKIGMEFIRKYNRAAIAGVVSTPPLGSLIFAIAWIAIYVREPEELQAKITTAFTVATYLMTTGALVIALVAYLDITTEDGDPRVRVTIDDFTSAFLKQTDMLSASRSEMHDSTRKGATHEPQEDGAVTAETEEHQVAH